MTAQLARPDSGSLRWLWLIAIPVLLLASKLIRTPPDEWLAMWLGESWMVCPWRVLTLAMPIFIGLLWSFGKLAPTRLRAAGVAAGLTAGAFAATVYRVHCPAVVAITAAAPTAAIAKGASKVHWAVLTSISSRSFLGELWAN